MKLPFKGAKVRAAMLAKAEDCRKRARDELVAWEARPKWVRLLADLSRAPWSWRPDGEELRAEADGWETRASVLEADVTYELDLDAVVRVGLAPFLAAPNQEGGA